MCQFRHVSIVSIVAKFKHAECDGHTIWPHSHFYTKDTGGMLLQHSGIYVQSYTVLSRILPLSERQLFYFKQKFVKYQHFCERVRACVRVRARACVCVAAEQLMIACTEFTVHRAVMYTSHITFGGHRFRSYVMKADLYTHHPNTLTQINTENCGGLRRVY
jgi:hypothetical protein